MGVPYPRNHLEINPFPILHFHHPQTFRPLQSESLEAYKVNLLSFTGEKQYCWDKLCMGKKKQNIKFCHLKESKYKLLPNYVFFR